MHKYGNTQKSFDNNYDTPPEAKTVRWIYQSEIVNDQPSVAILTIFKLTFWSKWSWLLANGLFQKLDAHLLKKTWESQKF